MIEEQMVFTCNDATVCHIADRERLVVYISGWDIKELLNNAYAFMGDDKKEFWEIVEFLEAIEKENAE